MALFYKLVYYYKNIFIGTAVLFTILANCLYLLTVLAGSWQLLLGLSGALKDTYTRLPVRSSPGPLRTSGTLGPPGPPGPLVQLVQLGQLG